MLDLLYLHYSAQLSPPLWLDTWSEQWNNCWWLCQSLPWYFRLHKQQVGVCNLPSTQHNQGSNSVLSCISSLFVWRCSTCWRYHSIWGTSGGVHQQYLGDSLWWPLGQHWCYCSVQATGIRIHWKWVYCFSHFCSRRKAIIYLESNILVLYLTDWRHLLNQFLCSLWVVLLWH